MQNVTVDICTNIDICSLMRCILLIDNQHLNICDQSIKWKVGAQSVFMFCFIYPMSRCYAYKYKTRPGVDKVKPKGWINPIQPALTTFVALVL